MFTFWNIASIVVVSVMGTAIAYVRDPEHKAFVLMLPFPFTVATLALGRPVSGRSGRPCSRPATALRGSPVSDMAAMSAMKTRDGEDLVFFAGLLNLQLGNR